MFLIIDIFCHFCTRDVLVRVKQPAVCHLYLLISIFELLMLTPIKPGKSSDSSSFIRCSLPGLSLNLQLFQNIWGGGGSVLLLSSALTLLQPQTPFFLSFLSSRLDGFRPPLPPLSPPFSSWRQPGLGLGGRRAVKAPSRPASTPSASLHPCSPLPQGPAQSVFTQVTRQPVTPPLLPPPTLLLFPLHLTVLASCLLLLAGRTF